MFDFVKKILPTPKNPVVELNATLYDALFMDKLEHCQKLKDNLAISWIFNNQKINENELLSICSNSALESRLRFFAAYHGITQGISIPKKIYFGSILEIPVNNGYDILAYYSDGTARYYNYSGVAIVIVDPIPDLASEINKANALSIKVCDVLKPWNRNRLSRPTGDTARFTFLNSDGIYFGQGPIAAMSKDPMGSTIIGAGANLMQRLIQFSQSDKIKSTGIYTG